jgi:hypothetical protein
MDGSVPWVGRLMRGAVCVACVCAVQLLIESQAKAGPGAGQGFDVARSGDGRVALIGFPR